MTTTLTKPRVPTEDIGIARQLLREVTAERLAFECAMDELFHRLDHKLANTHQLDRAEMTPLRLQLRDKIPHAFRLRYEFQGDRKCWCYQDVRLTGNAWTCESWDPEADEPGISLAMTTLGADKKTLSFKLVPLCLVSLHALARYNERAHMRDRATLFADLLPLALTTQASRRVEVSQGIWRGAPVVLWDGDYRYDLFRVQTFVTA